MKKIVRPMKTLIRFSTMKIRFLFYPFTSRKSLYVWHKSSCKKLFVKIAGIWKHEREIIPALQPSDATCLRQDKQKLEKFQVVSSLLELKKQTGVFMSLPLCIQLVLFTKAVSCSNDIPIYTINYPKSTRFKKKSPKLTICLISLRVTHCSL